MEENWLLTLVFALLCVEGTIAASQSNPFVCAYTNECVSGPSPLYNYTAWLDSHIGKISDPKGPNRVIISYAHNGLGNMMWEHTVAQMMAEELGASMYIDIVYKQFQGYWKPPNTDTAYQVVKLVLPPELFLDNLPSEHAHRNLCSSKNITWFIRPDDNRRTSAEARARQRKEIRNFATDAQGDYCMLLMGYFQDKQTNLESSRLMWRGFQDAPLKRIVRPTDMGLYLRCERTYGFPTPKYLESILNHSSWKQLYVMYNQKDCGAGRYLPTIRWLKHTYGAVLDGGTENPTSMKVPEMTASEFISYMKNQNYGDGKAFTLDEIGTLLEKIKNSGSTKFSDLIATSKWNGVSAEVFDIIHDIAMIMAYNKLIIPRSTFAYWGAYLSNASEIHQNLRDSGFIKDERYVFHDNLKPIVLQFEHQGSGKFDFHQFKNISHILQYRHHRERSGNENKVGGGYGRHCEGAHCPIILKGKV